MTETNLPRVLVVAGPTGSGKSAAAVRLARALGGEVVSVDSVQVYRGCDIGSGKLSHAEMQGVPHHMLDVCSPDQSCNAAEFARLAFEAVREVQARGRVPVLCGGTTLYLKALLYGLADLPAGSEALRGELEGYSNQELWERLLQVDPGSAERIHLNDRKRLVRALEAFGAGGGPASIAQAQHGYAETRLAPLMLVMCRARDDLYRRIGKRCREMLAAGMIEETAELMRCFGPGAPPLLAVGYRQIGRHLAGSLSREDLLGEISQGTRRLAKQQMTFWRNEPKKRGWETRPGEDETAVFLGAESAEGHSSRGRLGVGALDFSWNELLDRVQGAVPTAADRAEVWYLHASRLDEGAS